jgi:hypothetical protein
VSLDEPRGAVLYERDHEAAIEIVLDDIFTARLYVVPVGEEAGRLFAGVESARKK